MAVMFSEEQRKFQELLEKYIHCADYLLQKCGHFLHINGMQKLRRKCEAEMKYLKSLKKNHLNSEESHITSSNLGHYLGIVDAIEKLPDVTQVLHAFWSPRRSDSLHADVVAGQGHIWVKVIARKGEALHQIWTGQGQYGERDLMQMARDFVDCAAIHPVHFVEPRVVFVFYNGVTVPMATELNSIGIITIGQQLEVDESDFDSVGEESKSFGLSPADEEVVADESNVASLARQCPSREGVTQDEFRYEHNACVRFQADEDDNKSNDVLSPSTNTSKGHKQDNELPKTVRISPETNLEQPQSHSEHVVPDTTCYTQPNSATETQIREGNDETPSASIYLTRLPTSPLVFPEVSMQDLSLGELANTCAEDRSNLTHSVNFPSSQQKLPTKHTQIDCPKQEMESKSMSVPRGITIAVGPTVVQDFITSRLLTSAPADYGELDGVLTSSADFTIDNISRVNLDITALITLVSSVTHGRCKFVFKDKVLSVQAEEERADPVLPKLHQFLKGKQLFACQTAVSEFQTILDTLGGQHELSRAKELLETMTIVPDQPSLRTQALPSTGKIKERSKLIFGTGDSLKAVTITANSGFVRAAEHQGVLFAVFTHASRALTEQKEKTATPLCSDLDVTDQDNTS